jgi:hypothetical protein
LVFFKKKIISKKEAISTIAGPKIKNNGNNKSK